MSIEAMSVSMHEYIHIGNNGSGEILGGVVDILTVSIQKKISTILFMDGPRALVEQA